MMRRLHVSPAYIAALICILGVVHMVWLSFVCDDAFISFRYAKNLIEGHGLVFNAGERVEGYTNFLWVLVVALILDFGGRPEVWTIWIGTACGATTLFAVMSYQWRLRRDYLFAGILLAANSGFAAWATGGLETSLFTLLTTLAMLSLLWAFETSADRGETQSGATPMLLGAGALALASMTRPDGVLVTGLCGVFLLIHLVRKRFRLRMFLLWAAVWLVSYGAYFMWRYSFYGHLFPNTFYVKASGWEMLPAGLTYLRFAAQRFHLYMLAIPAIVLLIARRDLGVRKETLWFGALVIVPYLAYVASVGGDFMDMFRFVVPVIPLAMLIIGQTWHAFYRFLATQWPRIAAIGTVTALLVCTVGLNLFTSWQTQTIRYGHGLDSIGALRKYASEWTLAAHYLARVMPSTDSIAITAAGIIPYYTGMYTIDQLGLIAPDLSEYIRRKEPRSGHGLLASGRYIFRLRPQIIIGQPKLYEDTSMTLAHLFMEDDWFPEVLAQYQFVRARVSDWPPFYMPFALRNDIVAEMRLSHTADTDVEFQIDTSSVQISD